MPGICPRCLGEVYFAEEKLALGKVWHTFCFSCRNCRKLLDSCTVATHSGELFCRNCYNRLFSTTSVRPTLPSPLKSSLPTVDNGHRTVSTCESLSDCCCCCNCDKKFEFDAADTRDRVLEETVNCQSEKQRLCDRDCADGGDKEAPALGAEETLEIVNNVVCPETVLSQLDLRISQTTICDQSSNPIALSAWYNRHHSASQSTFSRPSSAQQVLRPSSTPTYGEAIGTRTTFNLSCSGNRRPGSPCRPNYKHREHSKPCHRHRCHEFRRSDKIADPHEESKIAKECRGRNFVQNYRNHLSFLRIPEALQGPGQLQVRSRTLSSDILNDSSVFNYVHLKPSIK